MSVAAVFPGTFDPITNGHIDIVRRASMLFSHLTVAVAAYSGKTARFSLPQRVEFVQEALAGISGVTVCPFETLLIELARARGVKVIVRGVRGVADFDYECQLAAMNRQLAEELETIFLPPTEANRCLSSSLVREVAALGGDVSHFVPPIVAQALVKNNLG